MAGGGLRGLPLAGGSGARLGLGQLSCPGVFKLAKGFSYVDVMLRECYQWACVRRGADAPGTSQQFKGGAL
jgi:hypothetical protein